MVRELTRDTEDSERRVRFICCEGYDDYNSYSPAVYMRVGGGRGALDTVRRAAPFLRPGDAGSAAAGLCGFLFKETNYGGDTGGTMSLDPPPPPGPDGTIHWEAFGGDGEIVLIDANSNSAKCVYGVIAGKEIRNLPFGRPKPNKR